MRSLRVGQARRRRQQTPSPTAAPVHARRLASPSYLRVGSTRLRRGEASVA